jgi:hypothetical protein
MAAAAALTLVSSLLSFAVFAARLFRIQVPLALFSLLTTIVSCAVLVPSWGVRGAAWSLLAQSVAHALGTVAAYRYALYSASRRFPIPLREP